MAGARLGAALRHIQRLFSEGSATGFSDTQLLGRFAAHRDEAAFAALMARHGRWCSRCAGACCAIRSTPKMRSRRRSSFWPGRPVRRGRRASSVAGCIGWRTGSPSGRVSTRHDVACTSAGSGGGGDGILSSGSDDDFQPGSA